MRFLQRADCTLFGTGARSFYEEVPDPRTPSCVLLITEDREEA